jgi:DNA-binding IclR family transcriptional regulator
MVLETVKSARRTLELFERFAEIRRPAKVTELYRRLGMPQSSASKLLKTFAKLGYLEYDGEHRTYYPTLRVALLGSWLHDQWFGHDSLLATIEALRTELGTSVLLGIQNDKHVLYMLALPSLLRDHPIIPIGTLMPICHTAVGKVLLMEKSERELDLLVRRINAEDANAETYINPAEFTREIAECRRRGYALSNWGLVDWATVIAMPLPQLPGQPRMALGLGAPREWMDENLDRVVQTVSKKLGALVASHDHEIETPA